MRTITFYSYKGGVGRSLLVANAARYLSTLGKTVFAIDLDLEAPGLHYKFELGPDAVHADSKPGVVDILGDFLKNTRLPASLDAFVSKIPVDPNSNPIHIMGAGTAPDAEYWRTLSGINWNDIFYGSVPVGIPFFLELKERIRSEFNPDFLLIDARTGMTEMGGVATTVLPDIVVCLGLASFEHLHGLRAVMRGIRLSAKNAERNIHLLAVISRLSARSDDALELENALAFLNAPIRDGASGLDLDEIAALHSEPLLDIEEQLLVAGKNSPHELPLLRDYLRLFSRMIPAEDIRPHVGKLIQQAIGRLLDDPDKAQSELESLTTYCADQEAYRALLKLYHVRKAPLDKLLATASLMWQLAGPKSTTDPLHLDIVSQGYSEARPTDVQKKYSEFAEAVWRATGMKDVKVGVAIANANLPERRGRAIRLLTDYAELVESPQYAGIIRLIEILGQARSFERAHQIIDRFKAEANFPHFYVAWAKLALEQRDQEVAAQTLDDPEFSFDTVRVVEPAAAYRLLKMAGIEDAEEVLREALEAAAMRGDMSQIRDLGEVFQDEGKFEEFEGIVRRWVNPSLLEEISESVRRRARRSRATFGWERSLT